MPLRITDPIPIKPKSPPPPPHLPQGILGDAFDPADVAGSTVLTITPLEQEKREWCWAACIQMVLTKLENPLRQCAILSKIPGLNAANCCGHEEDFKDTSLAATKMRGAWKSFGIKAKSHLGTAADGDERGRIPFEEVKTEIQAGRPIEVAIEWFEDGSHALLIKGFGQIGDEPVVWINDPLLTRSRLEDDGEGPILFSELRNANNYGVWVCTWTGLGEADV